MKGWLPDPPDLGPFRFTPSAARFRSLTLTARDGRMLDPDGTEFATLEELHAAPSLVWGRLPVVRVEEEGGPGLSVLWPDARGIEDPASFRARLLGVAP